MFHHCWHNPSAMAFKTLLCLLLATRAETQCIRTVYTIPASGTRAQQSDQIWCPDFVAPSAGVLHEVSVFCTGATNNNGFLVIRHGAQFRGSVFIANAVGPEVSIGSMAYEMRTRVISLDFLQSDRFSGLQITTLVSFVS